MVHGLHHDDLSENVIKRWLASAFGNGGASTRPMAIQRRGDGIGLSGDPKAVMVHDACIAALHLRAARVLPLKRGGDGHDKA
jgi:hypothetical protein